MKYGCTAVAVSSLKFKKLFKIAFNLYIDYIK